MAGLNKNPSAVVACLLLIVVTLACFLPVVRCGFINYDDPDYFSDNPHVQSGLTPGSMAWAFHTDQLASRYPLTWLSFMLDVDVFGKGPAGPHFTNLLLHVANAVLLFLLLRGLTGAHWRSLLVAALFALHPLHVEPVAWISERKGVLSTFFELLALIFFVRYVRQQGAKSKQQGASFSSILLPYFLSVFFFGCGLMAKPVVVTLPFVLLLLDYWPLQRVPTFGFQVSGPSSEQLTSSSPPASTLGPRFLWRLIWEKTPFLVLSVISCLVTFLVHRKVGAVVAMSEHSVGARIENALVSYARYLGKTIWPMNLAIPYPLPKHWPWEQVVVSAIVVVGLCVAFIWLGRRRPYLWVGWFWFLGTLVPVIGLVRWGDQAMADRFSYVPLIGLFIVLVWVAAEVCARWNVPTRTMELAAVLVLTACCARTLDQLRHWKNSETLFRHSLAVTENNYIACFSLGSALDDARRTDEALPLFFKAVKIAPRDPEGQYNLGTVLMKEGRLDEAAAHLAAALTNNPNFSRAHINLGNVLFRQGRMDEAAAHYYTAVALSPDDARAHYNLGTFLLAQSKTDEAVKHLSEAVRLQPDNGEIHANLAVALMRQGRAGEAITHFSEAVRFNPDNAETHFNLGLALLEQNRSAEAATHFSEALRLKPGEAKTHYRLAQALERQRKTSESIAQYREAIRLRNNYPAALNELARILSSDPDSKLRGGEEAVRLAQQACELTRYEQAAMVLTLAAAYAEAGRFPDAIANAQKAHDLALAAGQKDVVTKAEEMLKLFQSSRPFRETD